jgi:uncharacterized membrane protein YdbT with pleckstrin-like domain
MRAIIPTVLGTTLLAFVFYAGIVINISLLGVSIPGEINILIFAVLALLVIMQSLLTYVQTAHLRYYVYKNRIQTIGKKEGYVMFNSIQDMRMTKNILDDIFGTCSIKIQPDFVMKGLQTPDQTYAYLKQMMDYARSQYNNI